MKPTKSFTIFLALTTLAILLYNWQSITSALQTAAGNAHYVQWDLPRALESYSIAQKYASGSKDDAKIRYDIANTLYRNKLYTQAENGYLEIKTDNAKLRHSVAHNLGNTYYRLGESESGATRIGSWQQSVGSYDAALKIAEDPDTRANYEFVKKKLAEEKEKQKEDKKQESKDTPKDNQSGSGSSEKTGSWWSGKQPKKQEQPEPSGPQKWDKPRAWASGWQQPQSRQTWSNQGNYNSIGGNTQEKEDAAPLNTDQIQELENYGSSLREFQKQNGKFLNPSPENTQGQWGFMDQFFQNHPMLRDALPGGGGRDW